MTSRKLAASSVGVIAGVGAFALLFSAGLLLNQRLFGGAGGGLLVIAIVFGAAGAYAGWLLGMLVFSALYGSEEQEA